MGIQLSKRSGCTSRTNSMTLEAVTLADVTSYSNTRTKPVLRSRCTSDFYIIAEIPFPLPLPVHAGQAQFFNPGTSCRIFLCLLTFLFDLNSARHAAGSSYRLPRVCVHYPALCSPLLARYWRQSRSVRTRFLYSTCELSVYLHPGTFLSCQSGHPRS